MLRKVLYIIAVIIAIILLFVLVRALVHTFTGKPKITTTAPESSISQTAEDNAAKAKKDAPTPTSAATNTSTSTPAVTSTNNSATHPGSAAGKLSNTGPGETAMVVLATTSAVSTMYLVRRKQLAKL